MNNTLRIAALEALYATLPKIDCQQKCHEYCTTIPVYPLELRRMIAANPVKHSTTPWAGGAHALFGPQGLLGGACPFLKDGLCSVYTQRPMICRIWGLVKKMPCTFGCIPERWLTPEEENVIWSALERIAGP